MKKGIIGLLMIIFVFSACSRERESIEGYWMSENGKTISFNSNGKAISNGVSMDYSIYGEDNLSISLLGIASEYKYTIKKDVLTLIDLNKNKTNTFYRDDKKQQEIINKINESKAKKEQDKMEDEKIVNIEREIDKYKDLIKDAEWRISNNEKDIDRWEKDTVDRINECEESIQNGDDREYQENQRDEFINVNNESIASCKERIDKLNDDIIAYREEIKRLETRLKEIVK